MLGAARAHEGARARHTGARHPGAGDPRAQHREQQRRAPLRRRRPGAAAHREQQPSWPQARGISMVV